MLTVLILSVLWSKRKNLREYLQNSVVYCRLFAARCKPECATVPVEKQV